MNVESHLFISNSGGDRATHRQEKRASAKTIGSRSRQKHFPRDVNKLSSLDALTPTRYHFLTSPRLIIPRFACFYACAASTYDTQPSRSRRWAARYVKSSKREVAAHVKLRQGKGGVRRFTRLADNLVANYLNGV